MSGRFITYLGALGTFTSEIEPTLLTIDKLFIIKSLLLF